MKQKHSCFDWLQLVITFSTPVVIAVYTFLQDNRDLAIASHNREQDLNIADDQEKDTILRNCQKTLNKLIENYAISFNESTTASFVARFATLSALNQLDPNRRSFLIYLLYKAQLITSQNDSNHAAISLESANLTDINLNDVLHSKTLEYVLFQNALMTRANFYKIDIHGVNFNNAFLDYANFSGSTNSWECDNEDCDRDYKQKLTFKYSILESSSFYNAMYDVVVFDDANMIDTDLRFMMCNHCSFLSTNMTYTDLSNAHFQASTFSFARLMYANLERSNIGPDVDFDNADMRDIKAANVKLNKCKFSKTDLSKSILDYAIIRNSSFIEAKMMEISMQSSEIDNGEFVMVNLFRSCSEITSLDLKRNYSGYFARFWSKKT